MASALERFVRLMYDEGISEPVIRTFGTYYQQYEQGRSGKISKRHIHPPSQENLVEYDAVKDKSDKAILREVVMIKLNGGLGTSMGLSKAKSLLPVKGNMTFLDIIARQILTLRAQTSYDIPLLFMDSYNTQDDTLGYLSRYPDLHCPELPLDFLQNRFPRIRAEDKLPFQHKDKAQNWNPPGHGDIYTAMSSNGLLDKLIAKGIRYAFVSNADNLGANLDISIASYMKGNNIPFLMEVCLRSEVDKKGGHLSELKDGRLILREIAQCPDAEAEEFQNIELYRYFNTNNIWLDLVRLKEELDKNQGIMILPLIINPKAVNGTQIVQLETAMGSAISVFEGAKALVVPRSRFAPVKKTTDLLAIWSDAYELNDQYQIVLKRVRKEPPAVTLDERFYKSISQLQQRFNLEVPSLVNCTSLNVVGDITFGRDVACEGNVCIMADKPADLSNRVCAGIVTL